MASDPTDKPARKPRGKATRPGALTRFALALRRWLRRVLLAILALVLLILGWVALYAWVNPPGGVYMLQEQRRLGAIRHEWVDLDRIAPVMARSVVAAEDANFCRHFGFDLTAIRAALDQGAGRGASTLTQQVVKNVFLWHGRSWIRKALEAALTPAVEAIWGKRRIVEVYLNVAEFDAGVFGVQAAAQHYFSRDAAALTARQAALLAAVLPAPQSRDAARPSAFVSRRAHAIADGAETIRRDGRAACFDG
jgi:monofunctional biosynthetic peptidoglycan transglycosylase